MLSSLLYVYLVVSFVFEKLFSKSVECFEFLLGFENFEKTSPLLFLLKFFISVSSGVVCVFDEK